MLVSRREFDALSVCSKVWVSSLRMYDGLQCSPVNACKMMLRLHPHMFESDLRGLLRSVSTQVDKVLAEVVRMYATDESMKIEHVRVVPVFDKLSSLRCVFELHRAVPTEVKLIEIGGNETDVDRCYDSYLLTVNGSLAPNPSLCVPKDTGFPCPETVEDMDRIAAELLVLGASVVRLYHPDVHPRMTGVYNAESFSLGLDGVYEHDVIIVAARRALA